MFDIACQFSSGQRVRFGIQLKLTLLIVGLITAIFIALGTYIAREKKTILTETAIATAKKELASLAFIASRAILTATIWRSPTRCRMRRGYRASPSVQSMCHPKKQC